MRKLLVLLALLLPFYTTEAQEQADSATLSEWGVYHQALLAHGSTTHRVFGQGYSYFWWLPRCGYWGFGYGEEGYLSTTWGPFCDIGSYFSIGVAYGAESYAGEDGNNSIYGRWAVTAFIGTEKTFLEGYFENGPSKSPWHRVDLQLWANRYVAVGGISQTGDGFGPKLRLGMPVTRRTDARIWAAPTFAGKERNLLLGVELVWALKGAP